MFCTSTSLNTSIRDKLPCFTFIMMIRRADHADYPVITNIAVRAHINDDAMDAYLHPHRHKHRDAYYRQYLDFIEEHSTSQQCVTIVATEDSDPSHITGYACWFRQGKSQTALLWRHEESTSQFLKRKIRESAPVYYLNTFRNPASSFGHSWKFGKKEKYFDPNYKDPDEVWFLSEIAVDPEHQRKGIAMELLRWGMQLARKDGVPVCLNSTTSGEKLYEKAGFWEVGVVGLFDER
jgi:GNAT superfamily N-acetyltransferase